MIEIKDITYAYGEVKALHGISLKGTPGKITCITGRNGVGKTTLMKNIMGTLSSKSGSIILDGEDVTKRNAWARARKGIALVPQGRHIFPKLTVEENLLVGLEANPHTKTEIPEEIYATFPVLEQMRRRMGGDLSGGQQQQLAIGRALAGNPKVLLLDEPTEGIQPNIIQQIGEVLSSLAKERSMTIILVEQYLDFIKEFGNDFMILNRGLTMAQGPIDQLTDTLITEHLNV